MFDHRCAYGPCGKFGHSILNCRKLAADRERNTTNKGSNSSNQNKTPGKDDTSKN